MKYGREIDYGDSTRLVDVVEVPNPLPDWATDEAAFIAKMFPSMEGFIQVPDDVISGAHLNLDGTYTNPPSLVVKSPRSLSSTEFNEYAASQLGGGTTGMARFQQIMDACEAGTGAVKFCFTQYSKAALFDESKVVYFTTIMVTANIMTDAERTAVLDNWPTA